MTTRRIFLSALGLTLLAGKVPAQGVPAAALDGELTPPEAFELANAGDIYLIDIRRPDEWASTGSGVGAHRLDMRRDDFVDALLALVEGNTAAPVAVICARGHRSNRMSRALRDAGFTNLIDVPEGMLGSRAGPGWIDRGLPLNHS